MRTAIALEEGIELPVKQSGRVTRKTGSKKLYVDFCYNGVRIEKSTGLDDTLDNWQIARQWLVRQMEKIDSGRFVFAEAFPGASEKEKAFHAAREGWEYKPEPHNVSFADYTGKWLTNIMDNYRSVGKQRDFAQVIDGRLLPYFGEMTFHQINGVELQRFVSSLKWDRGKNAGKPLSRSRIRNILIPLRTIWNDACEENRWYQLPDPFRFLRKHLPREAKKHPEVFRFDDWMAVIKNMDPYYSPHAEVMIMTGMIGSELAGLRKKDVAEDHILVCNSIVKGLEKAELKTQYRTRKIPITKALRERLRVSAERASGEYLFTMKDGTTFVINSFSRGPWMSALDKAGVPWHVTYSARHSFAAWALTIGMDPNRLVRLMGHSSKAMVYDVYGNYVEGLEKDRANIRGYFGEDFTG